MISQDKNIKKMKNIWQKAVLPEQSNVGQAIRSLNDSRTKIVLIVNETNKLVGTISDGDIRRGLLRGLDLDSSIKSIIQRNALVVPPEIGRNTVLKLMEANNIQQIPILDDQQELQGLHLWHEVASPPVRRNLMVIMAGGRGSRLMPHTNSCPKPLVKIAGKPILEHIIESAKTEGFHRFKISIHYLGNMIEDVLGDGDRLGVEIEYLREQAPLGTAGALSLMGSYIDEPFVVTNGDLISDIRYGELLDFHNRHKATATMAVRVYEWQHPFGVVKTQGIDILGLEEKPSAKSYINAGVYALSPGALNVLIENDPCDMPVLFERLRTSAKRTVAYPMHEPWLDVGRPSDLEKANGSISEQTENGE